jgi:hypothetical protein
LRPLLILRSLPKPMIFVAKDSIGKPVNFLKKTSIFCLDNGERVRQSDSRYAIVKDVRWGQEANLQFSVNEGS